MGNHETQPFPSIDGQRDLSGYAPADVTDAHWAWHDTRLIGLDRGADAGAGRYEIGVLDLYADLRSGDLGGSYLTIAAFDKLEAAVTHYYALQQEVDTQMLAPYQVADFAEAQAFALNPEPANWRSAQPAEYAAYEALHDLEVFDPVLADVPPDDALDPLLQTALALGGVVVGTTPSQTEGIDGPPVYDATTGTTYWIGVYQPEPDHGDLCIASILSLRPDPDTGEVDAQLAPCVPGDREKACAVAEYLHRVAQKGDMQRVFDVAEGMALAAGQHAFWETARGTAVAPDAARQLAAEVRPAQEVER